MPGLKYDDEAYGILKEFVIHTGTWLRDAHDAGVVVHPL